MIELRWKIEPLVKCDPADNGIYGVRRTLQFRTQALQMGSGYRKLGAGDGNTYVVQEYQRPMGMAWTEWQDVPEFASGQLADDTHDAASCEQSKEKP